MTFLHFVALATIAATSAFAAPQLVRRCDVPGVNAGIRDTIYKVALSRGLNSGSLCMEVMFVTAIQESNVNNLDCGDKDSLGIFQQRPSQGWGTPAQLQDPNYSTNKFLDVAIPICNAHPNEDAGDIAQEVQGSEAGNFYTQHEAEARQLIAAAKASVGGGSAPAPSPSNNGGGAVNVGSSPTPKPKPSSSKPAPKPSSKKPAPAPKPTSAPAPAPPAPSAPAPSQPSGGEDPADCDNLPEDIPENCATVYTPIPGDNCYKVSGKFGIPLSQFFDMNPSIDAQCLELQVTRPYCVGLDN